MPLGPEYDKMIDCKFADMKNTGGRFGGSITAAQFIGRFVGKTPWAHLDIAGTGFASPSSDISKSWGSGWGVRLLDRLVAEEYEKYEQRDVKRRAHVFESDGSSYRAMRAVYRWI